MPGNKLRNNSQSAAANSAIAPVRDPRFIPKVRGALIDAHGKCRSLRCTMGEELSRVVSRYHCMDPDPNAPDAEFYLRKAAHYRNKAKAVTEAPLKTALEALAREYELRARHAGGYVDPKVGKPIPVRSSQGSLHHR
jgi:hypothetical protein